MENVIREKVVVNQKIFEVDNSPKTTLDYARKYRSMGLSIIPIQRGKKVPALETWKKYQDKPPADVELIEWFSSNRQGIATVSGVNGYFVLEFDDAPGAFSELTKFCPWLHTPTLTGKSKRGLHVHLQCESLPHYITHLVRKYGEGQVEFRGHKTYTLLAPSIHPSGLRYTWINPEVPILKITREQLNELISWFTVSDEKYEGEDHREAFNSQDVPPIMAADAEEALQEAIKLAEPDKSRNIVGYLLARKLRYLGLTMAEAYPFMISYWKAMCKTGSTRYEKYEAKSSLRSAFKDRDESENVGFYLMLKTLYDKNLRLAHNCKEFHDKTILLINLRKGTGNGRHGHAGRLDCPGCIWDLGYSVTSDMGANFKDSFWKMALPLKDKNELEALEKRVRTKKGGDGAGIGLASFEDKEMGIAANYQADPRMEFVSWTDTEKMKEFLTKYLSLEPNSKGEGKHKIRPFGAFVREDRKDKGDGESHKLSVPASNADVKESLKSMESDIEDNENGFYA